MERARLFASYLFSIALLALAASLAYCTTQVVTALPELLQQVERTSQRIEPLVVEVGNISEQVPVIATEVAAVSEQIPAILSEVEAVRSEIPSILAESAAIRKQLPAVLAETRALREQVPPVLAEVEAVRKMMPSTLAQAERLVLAARDAGKQASEGAVTGFLTGIVKAPFSMISGVGSTLFGASDLNKKDLEAIDKAARQLLARDQLGGRSTWSNRKSGASGTIFLEADTVTERSDCRLLRFDSRLKGKGLPTQKLVVCQHDEQGWVIDAVLE